MLLNGVVTDKKNRPAEAVYLLMITAFLDNYFVREVKGQDRAERYPSRAKAGDPD